MQAEASLGYIVGPSLKTGPTVASEKLKQKPVTKMAIESGLQSGLESGLSP